MSLTDADALARTCTDGRPPCKNASHPKLSSDGERVVFDSDAPDMLSGLTPPAGVTQLYVRDIDRRRTRLVSGRTVDGRVVFADAPAAFGDISGDGRFVVFGSEATNLAASDRAGHEDVFVSELDTGEIARVSEGPLGEEFNAPSTDPAVSFDGRFVVFASAASNVAPLFAAGGEDGLAPPSDGGAHVYLADRARRRFEWLDRAPGGGEEKGSATQPVVSADGGVVVFTSSAALLAGEDGNAGGLDVFACRRRDGSMTLVSAAFRSTRGGAGVSRKPQVSGDGRFVVFESVAADLIEPGRDTNEHSDVFVRDLARESTVRVSVASDGAQANGTSGYSAISFDGRYVAFSSTARRLVPNDTTRGFLDFFVHDRDVSGDGVFDTAGDICTRRLSITPDGIESNARSGGNGSLSADGRFAAFMSESNLLHPGDDNGVSDKQKCSPRCLFGRDVFRARVY